ncbi:MAG: DUF5661 family protein [Anaerolineae bacterium]
MKGQGVRLLDVFVVGPVFFWSGRRLADNEPIFGGLLMTLGALTVFYNGANYMTQARLYDRIYSDTGADPWQLQRGIEVEMEHTTDPAQARKIAIDHLREHPKYYSKLIQAGL